MDAFYHTREKLEQETLEEFLMELDLWDYELIAREAKKNGGEWLFTKYRKSFVRGLQNAVEVYARDVDQSDYYDGFDVNTTVSENTFLTENLWDMISREWRWNGRSASGRNL